MTWLQKLVCFGLSVAIATTWGCDDGTQMPPTPQDPPPDMPPTPEFGGASAHWVTQALIAIPADTAGDTFALHYAPDNAIAVNGDNVEGGETLALTVDSAGLPAEVLGKFPHLGTFRALRIAEADLPKIGTVLQGQMAVASKDADGNLRRLTGVQIPGVLDDLYTYDGDLGVTFADKTPTFRLWAPTAKSVKLHIYDANKDEITGSPVDMTAPAADGKGVWVYAAADSAWYEHYYKYEVEVFAPTASPEQTESPPTLPGTVVTNMVTDPYSVGLATNSEYSLLIDLSDPDTFPVGWTAPDQAVNNKPVLAAEEDIAIYEAHIRDFSIGDASVTDADHRGKYLAFTYDGATDDDGRALSDGMAHLQGLAEAGLTHVHLLPTFDIATVEEDPAKRVDLDSTFATLCERNSNVPQDRCDKYGSNTIAAVLEELRQNTQGNTEEIQEVIGYMRDLDGYNWGYDPFHYTTPEGSYATTADGVNRIKEFREMVMGLANIGLRTVMDVVYNHTNASGQADKSVLDRIVPGYYHRLNTASGEVERSTCCDNTATEHAMMEKLMLDSLRTWIVQYKLDGFRFDLMGHHMKANMLKARDALQALTVDNDGIDGSQLYIYGEGWDFGEVGANTRGENATQFNLSGTGIGTFSDRLRDAVRGGGPFDSGLEVRINQGFVNGAFYDSNEQNAMADKDELKKILLAQADQIRVGMAGNLATFVIRNQSDKDVLGAAVSYNGYPAGYTSDPQEVITYIAAHDNQTWWDNNQYKIPLGTDMNTRVRIQNLGMSIALLAQGVPFIHMGQDILRSKSMERDSYDSGDWFNAVDFTLQRNNWNVGLPRKDKDGDNYELIRLLIADRSIDPQPEHIAAALDHVKTMLRIRKSSRLFRLTTGADVQTRVNFHNVGKDQDPGLLVMSITDGTCVADDPTNPTPDDDLDAARDGVLVFINANDEPKEFSLAGTLLDGIDGFELHPEHAASSDADAQAAQFDPDTQTFSIPARTAVVFQLPQGAAQGDGLPCNLREGSTDLTTDVFLRGDFNGFEANADAKFSKAAASTYEAVLTLEAGTFAFKIADTSYATYNLGAGGGATIAPGQTLILVPGGGNIKLTIAAAGSYKFTLDSSNPVAPTLTLQAQ